jgi:hypothetical protein
MEDTSDSTILPFAAALLINPKRRSLSRSWTRFDMRRPAVDFNKTSGSASRMDASLLRRGEEMKSQSICFCRKVILLCHKKKKHFDSWKRNFLDTIPLDSSPLFNTRYSNFIYSGSILSVHTTYSGQRESRSGLRILRNAP